MATFYMRRSTAGYFYFTKEGKQKDLKENEIVYKK